MVRLIHAAIREDLRRMEAASLLSGAGVDLSMLRERCKFLAAYLSAHDAAETAVLSPKAEAAAPSTAGLFETAHRHVREALESLGQALLDGSELAVGAALARTHAVVRLHLDMEDEMLLPLCQANMEAEEQLLAVGKMSEYIPIDVRMAVVGWMPPLLVPDDRETLVRFYLANIPAGPLQSVLQAVREALGQEDWEALERQVPELSS